MNHLSWELSGPGGQVSSTLEERRGLVEAGLGKSPAPGIMEPTGWMTLPRERGREDLEEKAWMDLQERRIGLKRTQRRTVLRERQKHIGGGNSMKTKGGVFPKKKRKLGFC